MRVSRSRPAKTQVRAGRAPIVRSALDNFQKLGYHGTSMRDIARDAKVTVAAIYHHFPSKQQILREIMTTVLVDALSETRAAVEGAGERPVDQLAALMHAWVVFHCLRQPEALIAASEIRSLEPESRESIVALRDEQEELFRRVVDDGLRDGSFTTPVPLEAVRALIAMGSSVASWYRLGDGLTPDELASRYVVVALATVGA
ncbi:TetR family transcriptional regulator [Nocardia sp. R7R-8]|uniref:TetR family transcriptional regulator n=1 Tax=Nocardia sp. R7R-8 TaxID=3459304 RepID=UPI00403D7EC9